jgi:polysaccharide biosynthesis/export protein
MLRRTRTLVSSAAILCGLALTGARAQEYKQPPDAAKRSSDLAVRNLNRVSASVAELKVILAGDPGLMVELKRLYAKDASDHGQIVTDSDLTDSAMYERLEKDVPFRSAATLLVQKYGYLVPKLNPESEMAREEELLVQERTKWIAQHAEQERARDQQNALERASAPCTAGSQQDPRAMLGCQQQGPSPTSTPPALPGQLQGPSYPQQQNYPASPNEPMGSPAPEQLLRASSDATGFTAPLQYPQMDALSMLSSSGSSGQSPLLMASSGRLGDSRSSEFSPGLSGSAMGTSDGLLGAFGLGGGLGGGMTGGLGGSGLDLMSLNMAGASSMSMSGLSPRFDSSGLSSSLAPSSGMQTMVQMPVLRRPPAPQPDLMVRKPMPYRGIPSLYDMYVQAVAHPSTPERFGKVVFDNGSRDPQLIPMDLPAGPDYVIGPGDGLSVDLWGGMSQRLYRVVDREGRISLPEVGPVLVSGKSLSLAQQDLQQTLKSQFRDVSADISLARLRTIRVYEVGEVSNPGAYDISSLSTPLNALFSGGGPTAQGSMRLLNHYRGGQLVQTVDLYDLLLHGVKADLKRLDNGDTIQVPPIGPQVTIDGMVRRPAIYELKDEKNLADVLELAGGLLPVASLRHVEVQRLVAHKNETMLNLDVPDTDSDSDVTKKLEAFQVLDGDRIRIYPIAPYNQDVIYLDGNVVRPGRYSYRANMKVTDVVSSFKDLLPEPATAYAEIIRLNAPDFHPSVESFNLAEAFNNPDQAPVLRPMDTVRIFSRFDFEDVPRVSVLGDVREPGTYEAAGQIHLSDAVHLAGGLSAEAETSDAQVFRYLADNKVKIFSVNLGSALAGDPLDNILLQPRDRLLIHKSADIVEPASVLIQGEVGKPGRYPLSADMHVADLIRVGGGLTPGADTKSADLTLYDWSDPTKLDGQHETVALSAALAGDAKANAVLHNGDVLTIRQLPGWNDLAAAIRIDGEVKHPGSYGIQPGERLSSILERAGGFSTDAYPYGAILEREQVRELEVHNQNDLMVRVKESQAELEGLPAADAAQKQAKEATLQQWHETLLQLSENPPTGRVSIRISSNLNAWKNTSADIEVRAGDTLVVPKKPGYVMVTGQVFNATAVSYRSGKSAKWYLAQAGGPTAVANRKAIFVIRADGSVVGGKRELWVGDSLNVSLRPGDTVVVPEKPYGGPVQWQNVFSAAQMASSIATSVFIGLHY